MTSLLKLIITEDMQGNLDAQVQIDGKPFGNECVDLVELRNSAIGSGGYELLSCSCGIPQCAGFWEPIFVQHDGDYVRWECDARYYPIVQKDENAKFSVLRYEFDRMQYINEIRVTFEWLRRHKNRDSLGPHGFDASLFDKPFPDTSTPRLPFPDGATIVVGYAGEYLQPWVWVEGQRDTNPGCLLPGGALWKQFEYWSAMWDSARYSGICLYRKSGCPFQLSDEISLDECNDEVESLAREIQAFWGSSANVVWEERLAASTTRRRRHALNA